MEMAHLVLSFVFRLQWRSMSKEEQSVYFKMAEQLRHIHKLNNPNWSNQLNYVSMQAGIHVYSSCTTSLGINHRINVSFPLFRVKRGGGTDGEKEPTPWSPKLNTSW